MIAFAAGVNVWIAGGVTDALRHEQPGAEGAGRTRP